MQAQLIATNQQIIFKNATSMPDTTMAYDIGNSNYKYQTFMQTDLEVQQILPAIGTQQVQVYL